jgi:peptidyl-prolyl cis-trans isomerase SurA
MNKKWNVLILAFFLVATASAQTLFTYGSYSADEKDFLRAFNKNNSTSSTNKSKAMRDYLDLYIASRLKIREAYNRGYDTLQQIKNDIENLRSQIIENYLNDPQMTDKLEKEAFARSQKDIHVGHIYISFRDKIGVIDTLEAEAKAKEVYDKLKKGEDFSKLAEEYSSDAAAKTNKGDIGYITVFSLPYEYENVIYNTPVGKYSSIYRSKIGFHIFKNIEERKAAGIMKAAQILIAFPPNADDAAKKETAALADSLYQRLLKGDDIGKLAGQFSNDYVSAASNGVIPDFTVGQYDPAFETSVFGLKKNGDISKPILTSHGYHIVKRIELKPVNSDPKNKESMDLLKIKVGTSDRMQYAKNQLMEKVLKQVPVKYYVYTMKDLSILSDSLLDGKPLALPVTLTRRTPLFSIGNEIYSVNNFITYAQSFRYKTDGSGVKSYQQLIDEFKRSKVEEYYRSHLEDYNPEFRNQMNEFKDGNLFFEIMQQEVWNKAQNDSVALRQYFDKNKIKYSWKQSADAVIFFCSDEATAKELYADIKKDPAAWKIAADVQVEKAVADSARYEFAQIPNAANAPIKTGLVTNPVTNKTDGTVSFAYILKTYPAGMPRNFAEAKGLVISDYQNELEKQWVVDLKKKYPVKINEAVFQQISK